MSATSVPSPTLPTFEHSSRSLASWLGAAFCAVTLTACGGAEHYAPAPAGDGEPAAGVDSKMNATSGGSGQTVSITETASDSARGWLDVLAIGAMKQSLGSLEFTVRNRAGAVLSSGYNQVQGADMDRRLLLDLPAGVDYELALDSTGSGKPGAGCHATISPLSIETNSTASYQAFLWQCDGASLAPAPEKECYWLADWVGAARTHAAVGESIELSVEGNDVSGVSAHVTWTNQAPQYGSISDRHSVRTTFSCEAPNESVPLTVVITGDGCSRRLTLNVTCDAN